MRFTGEQLSDEELVKIWEAYDVNGDGRMDREELSFLMEDLCEVQQLATTKMADGSATFRQCSRGNGTWRVKYDRVVSARVRNFRGT